MTKKLNMLTINAMIAIGSPMALANVVSANVTLALGGGWQATFDAEHIGLIVQSVSLFDDTLVIQKSADFTQLNKFTGAPQGLTILFTQVGSDAATVHNIVIDDEVISNHTGLAWTGFRSDLLGSSATFDSGASTGFSTAPFTTTTYNGLDQVTFSGGVVANGGIWTPGLVSGALVMHVDLSSSSPVSFVLKERPLVPTPGAMALLGLAGVSRPRRRREA